MRRIGTLLGQLIVFAATNVWTQGKPVCSRLTASDVSAVGATGQGIPGEMPISGGPTKGETMKMCSWRMQAGGLHLSVSKVPPGMSRDAVIAELNKNYVALKAQGWTEEKKDFGGVFCNLMTPPAGKQDMPATTVMSYCCKRDVGFGRNHNQNAHTYGEAQAPGGQRGRTPLRAPNVQHTDSYQNGSFDVTRDGRFLINSLGETADVGVPNPFG